MAAAPHTLTDTELLPLLHIIDCEELLQLSRGADERAAHHAAWNTTTAHEVIALLELAFTKIRPEYRADALKAAWDILADPEERAKATASLSAYVVSSVSRLISDTIIGDGQCASPEEIHNHKRDDALHSKYTLEDLDLDGALRVTGAMTPGSDAHLDTLDEPERAVELPGRAYIDELVILSGLPDADTDRILETLADALDRGKLRDSIGRSDAEHAATLAMAVATIARNAELAEINGFPTTGPARVGGKPVEAGPQWRAMVSLILGTSTSKLPGLIAVVAGGTQPTELRYIRTAMAKVAA